jgi:hypothetical protein
MTLRVVFEIIFEGISKDVIASKLSNIELKVLPYSVSDLDGRRVEPNTIMCMAILPQNVDALGLAAGRINSLRIIDGIKQVNIAHVSLPEKETRRWFKHPIFPIVISTLLTFLTVYGTLLGLHVKLNNYNDYFVAFILPTITSASLAILYKFY